MAQPRDPLELRLLPPLARINLYMRRGGYREVDIAQGLLDRQLEGGGILRDDNDGGVLRRGLEGHHPGRVRGRNRHPHRAAQHEEDKEVAGRDGPAVIQEGPEARRAGDRVRKSVTTSKPQV